MNKRSKTYVGAYIGAGTKEALQTEAKSEHRTMSQQLTRILDLHLQGKDAERQACATAICEQCRAGIPLIFSEGPRKHRFIGETVSGWIHQYERNPASDDLFFEECAAALIHERSRMEKAAGVQ